MIEQMCTLMPAKCPRCGVLATDFVCVHDGDQYVVMCTKCAAAQIAKEVSECLR